MPASAAMQAMEVPLEEVPGRPAKVTSIVPPLYPKEAEAAHQGATIDVYGIADAQGRYEVKRIEGEGEAFREAVREVAGRWLVRPEYSGRDCSVRPVETLVRVWFEYKEERGGVVSISAPPKDLPARKGFLREVERKEPSYPAGAIRAGVQGSFEVYVAVTPDGSVRDVVVAPAPNRDVFAPSLVKTMKNWKYEPWSGADMRCAYYPVNFKLHY